MRPRPHLGNAGRVCPDAPVGRREFFFSYEWRHRRRLDAPGPDTSRRPLPVLPTFSIILSMQLPVALRASRSVSAETRRSRRRWVGLCARAGRRESSSNCRVSLPVVPSVNLHCPSDPNVKQFVRRCRSPGRPVAARQPPRDRRGTAPPPLLDWAGCSRRSPRIFLQLRVAASTKARRARPRYEPPSAACLADLLNHPQHAARRGAESAPENAESARKWRSPPESRVGACGRVGRGAESAGI